MDRKRILHVLPRSRGGIREHLLLLLRELSRIPELELFVLSPADEYLQKKLSALGIPHQIYGGSGGASSEATLFFSVMSSIKKLKINIVHSHGYKAGLAAGFACRALRKKHISVIHTDLVKDGDGAAKKTAKHLAQATLADMSNDIIFVSDEVKRTFPGAGRLGSKAHVIHTGADFDNFEELAKNPESRDALGFMAGDKVIGCVARLSKEKGAHVLLDAMPTVISEYPDAKLLLIGDGPVEAELRGQADRLRIADKCVFTGFRSDISRLVPIMDMFVLPSLSEAFGLALMEALYHVKPVVATTAGGIPEIVTDGVTGRLVAPGDAKTLARAIINTLRTPEESRKMADAGRAHVIENFTLENMSRKTVTLYQR